MGIFTMLANSLKKGRELKGLKEKTVKFKVKVIQEDVVDETMMYWSSVMSADRMRTMDINLPFMVEHSSYVEKIANLNAVGKARLSESALSDLNKVDARESVAKNYKIYESDFVDERFSQKCWDLNEYNYNIRQSVDGILKDMFTPLGELKEIVEEVDIEENLALNDRMYAQYMIDEMELDVGEYMEAYGNNEDEFIRDLVGDEYLNDLDEDFAKDFYEFGSREDYANFEIFEHFDNDNDNANYCDNNNYAVNGLSTETIENIKDLHEWNYDVNGSIRVLENNMIEVKYEEPGRTGDLMRFIFAPEDKNKIMVGEGNFWLNCEKNTKINDVDNDGETRYLVSTYTHEIINNMTENGGELKVIYILNDPNASTPVMTTHVITAVPIEE